MHGEEIPGAQMQFDRLEIAFRNVKGAQDLSAGPMGHEDMGIGTTQGRAEARALESSSVKGDAFSDVFCADEAKVSKAKGVEAGFEIAADGQAKDGQSAKEGQQAGTQRTDDGVIHASQGERAGKSARRPEWSEWPLESAEPTLTHPEVSDAALRPVREEAETSESVPTSQISPQMKEYLGVILRAELRGNELGSQKETGAQAAIGEAEPIVGILQNIDHTTWRDASGGHSRHDVLPDDTHADDANPGDKNNVDEASHAVPLPFAAAGGEANAEVQKALLPETARIDAPVRPHMVSDHGPIQPNLVVIEKSEVAGLVGAALTGETLRTVERHQVSREEAKDAFSVQSAMSDRTNSAVDKEPRAQVLGQHPGDSTLTMRHSRHALDGIFPDETALAFSQVKPEFGPSDLATTSAAPASPVAFQTGQTVETTSGPVSQELSEAASAAVVSQSLDRAPRQTPARASADDVIGANSAQKPLSASELPPEHKVQAGGFLNVSAEIVHATSEDPTSAPTERGGIPEAKDTNAAPNRAPGSALIETVSSNTVTKTLDVEAVLSDEGDQTFMEAAGMVSVVGEGGAETRHASSAQAIPTMTRHDLPTKLALQIADAARQLPDKPVEITLSPEELGKVRLSFHISENGAMNVVVAAERIETIDLMRRNIDSLINEFKSIGYEGSAFSFQSFDGHPQDPQGSGQTAQGALSPEESTMEPPLQSVDPVRVNLSTSSGMDLRL